MKPPPPQLCVYHFFIFQKNLNIFAFKNFQWTRVCFWVLLNDIFDDIRVLMCWCVDMLMCQCVDMLMCWYVDMLCWCVLMWIIGSGTAAVCWCVDVLICCCTDVLMCWCAEVLMHWWHYIVLLRLCCVKLMVFDVLILMCWCVDVCWRVGVCSEVDVHVLMRRCVWCVDDLCWLWCVKNTWPGVLLMLKCVTCLDSVLSVIRAKRLAIENLRAKRAKS